MVFRKTESRISDHAWRDACAAFPLLQAVDGPEAGRLRALAARFLRSKSVEPVQNLALGPGELAGLAALACVPVLELGLGAYDDWTSLVVYPGGFMVRGHEVDEAGVVHEFDQPRSGEAWLRGPVVLSWEDVAASGQGDGYNVVIHEMAHKLDMRNGDANGFPPLHPGMDATAWHAVFSAAFDDLNSHLDAGRSTPLDDYAAQSPGEFFAVTSEYFFELPQVLERAYREVYRQLAAYYRQDPGARTPVR